MTTVAIVGYGYWGPNLLRNYMQIPESYVKWVCDLRSEVLDKALQRKAFQRALRANVVVDGEAIWAALESRAEAGQSNGTAGE